MDVVQIGLGAWGRNHARVWDELRKEEIIDKFYVFDLDKELQSNAERRYDVTGIDDLNSLNGLDVDLVDIVVPASVHYQVAKPFVERGINTLVEKPITDKLEHAQDLIDISSDPVRKIMVGHIFRYHVGVKLAKELIEKGAIGEVKKLDIRRTAFRKPRPDNGVVLSLGIHDLDLFNYFNKEEDPKSIQALISTIIGPTEDHAFIKVDYEHITALAEESWMSPTSGKIRSCKIQGTEGEISFDFSNPSEVEVHSKYFDLDENLIDNGKFTHRVQFKEPLKEELTDFVSKTRNGMEYVSTPQIGLKSLSMCLSALKSGISGRRVDF